MRKKWTLFLACCMLAATSVSANTVADAAKTETKAEATKGDAKEVKDEKAADKKDAKDEKATDKKDAKDEKAADKKDAKDEKAADKKDAKDEKAADKKDAKDEKAADKKDAKDEKAADAKDAKDEKAEDKKDVKALSDDELKAKVKDLKNDQIIKTVIDAYKAEVELLTAYDPSEAATVAGYHELKSDYATKEKVEAYLGKTLSASYVEGFFKKTADDRFKVIDEKCYVKGYTSTSKLDFDGVIVKSTEVKDGKLNVVMETRDEDDKDNAVTYKATLVFENDAWKVEALSYQNENQNEINGSALL